MKVRELIEADIKAVIELDDLSTNYVEEWIEGNAYGIFEDSLLVGYCTLGYADDCGEEIDNYKGKTNDSRILSNLYVRREYRGRGYATTLIKTSIKECNEIVFLNYIVDSLIPFYEKLGFKYLVDNVMVFDL